MGGLVARWWRSPSFSICRGSTERAVRRDPTKRASKIRRWLTYLTLFVAAGILIGDAIALVNGVLGGELTIRFMLKVVTIAVIAGAIFGYYLRDLRRDEDASERRGAAEHDCTARTVSSWARWSASVVLAVGAGLFLAGSPSEARSGGWTSGGSRICSACRPRSSATSGRTAVATALDRARAGDRGGRGLERSDHGAGVRLSRDRFRRITSSAPRSSGRPATTSAMAAAMAGRSGVGARRGRQCFRREVHVGRGDSLPTSSPARRQQSSAISTGGGRKFRH